MRSGTDAATEGVGTRVNVRFERPVFSRARRLCLALPETTETSSWGFGWDTVGRRLRTNVDGIIVARLAAGVRPLHNVQALSTMARVHR
jgi:hypothetical protein